ncbi:hypothetical protein EMCRGX_G023396 [Ephydatia muelleri]
MAKEPKQKEANVEKQDATETLKYAASSSAQLKTLEEELFELVQLSEVPLDKELFKEILELLKVNVAPAAILQVLSALSTLESGRRSTTPTEGGSSTLTRESNELAGGGQLGGSPDHSADPSTPPGGPSVAAPQPPPGSSVAAPQPPKGTHSKPQSKTTKLKRPMSSK